MEPGLQLGIKYSKERNCQSYVTIPWLKMVPIEEDNPEDHIVNGFSFLVSYVEEWPWWPTQSPYKGRKKKAKGQEAQQNGAQLYFFTRGKAEQRLWITVIDDFKCLKLPSSNSLTFSS